MPEKTLKKCPKCGRKAGFCIKKARMSFEQLKKATRIELMCYGEVRDRYGYLNICYQEFFYYPHTGKITEREK